MNGTAKAQQFLNYVATNRNHLRKILRKNITFDGEIFDDAFNDAIVKAYNSIEKNNTEIANYEQYFFITLKWTYVAADNRNKKRKKVEVRDYFDNGGDLLDDDYNEKDTSVISTIKAIVADEFGEDDANAYFMYKQGKIKGHYTFKMLADDTGRKQGELSRMIKIIDKFIREECRYLYN